MGSNEKVLNKNNSSNTKIKNEEDEAIDEDPDFYRGTYGVFNFPNGDMYEGDYIAHISGSIWREGKGTYTTQDGQIYSGIWYSDQLKEDTEAEITYPNGSKYVGKLAHCQYSDSSMYIVQEGFFLLCNFVNNKPVGDICLLDTKGREWRAVADENEALLLPEHTFFNDIPARLGKGTLRIQRARQSADQMSMKSFHKRGTMDPERWNKLEMKIFAKTKKTVSNLKFEDSSWYHKWLAFRKAYDTIQCKLRTRGEDGLCQEERDWLDKYTVFKEKYRTVMDIRHKPKYKNLKDYKLFELYNSSDYMPAILVFSSTYGEDREEKLEDQADEECFSHSFAWQ